MSYPIITRNRYHRAGETNNRQHSPYHHEEDWQDFHLPLAYLHQRHLHTWGICAGLEVSGAPDARAVIVQPGVAIDAEGRMIVLADGGFAQTQAGNRSKAPFNLSLEELTGLYFVTLAYAENEEAELSDTTGRNRPTNVQQAPLLQLTLSTDFVNDGRSLILAVVQISDDHHLLGLDEHLDGQPVRRLAGQSVQSLVIQRPVMRDGQVHQTEAGQLAALPTGGLRLTVANDQDRIELGRTDGGDFATVHIQARQTQIQGALTVQDALTVTGIARLRDVEVPGAINASEYKLKGVPLDSVLQSLSPWRTSAAGITYNGGAIGIGTTTEPTAQLHLQTNTVAQAPLRIQALTRSLPGWAYRKPIQITSAVSLHDYQLRLQINLDDLRNTPKMRGIGEDFCFTAGDGQTVLSHWLEQGSPSYAHIWVKVPIIAAEGVTTIYLYYGNSTAINRSSLHDTFAGVVDGLIGAWSFEAIQQTQSMPPQTLILDSSGNDLPYGRITGAELTSGRYGRALSISNKVDQVQYFTVELVPQLSQVVQGEFSVEAWVYPLDFDTEADRTIICHTGSFELCIRPGGNLFFILTHIFTGVHWIDTGVALAIKSWSHLVWTYSHRDGTVHLYINGQMVYSGSGHRLMPQPLIEHNKYLSLGCRYLDMSFDFACPFAGQIDEVRIYARELSVGAAQALYCYYGHTGTAQGLPYSRGRVLLGQYVEPLPQWQIGDEQSFAQNPDQFFVQQDLLTISNENGNGSLGVGTKTPQGLFDIKGHLTVTNDGRVGIGTTAPQGWLDVKGLLTVTPDGTVAIGRTNTPSTVLPKLEVNGDLHVWGDQNLIKVVTITKAVQNLGIDKPNAWRVTYAGFRNVYAVFTVLQGFSLWPNADNPAFTTWGHAADVGAIPQHVFVRVDRYDLSEATGFAYCSEARADYESNNSVLFTVVVLGMGA